MAFRKYSNVGGHKYAYLVESYRDAGKVRQRTLEYLGRVSIKNGQEVITPPRKRLMGEPKVKTVQRYGDVRVLYQIIKELDMVDIIDRCTIKGGLSPGKLLTMMAINKLVEPQSTAKLSRWYEDTALVDLAGVSPSKINPDSVGAAFDAVCAKTDAGAVEDRFFQIEMAIWERLQEYMGVDKSSIVYDLTSTYVYGTTLPLAAKGYSRDGNWNEQYNVALAVTWDKRLPLHFRVLPGNIVDVSTLRMFLAELKAFGIEGATLVMDRGFYSALNLVEAAGNGHQVIGAIPARMKLHRRLLAKAKDIEHNKYAVRRGKEIVYLKEILDEVKKKERRVPIKAVVVLNPEKRENDRRRQLGAILEAEERLRELSDRMTAGEYVASLKEVVEDITKDYERCFEVRYSNGHLSVKRKHKAVQRVQNRCGMYVLFSTDLDLDATVILDRYREKDMVEKAFFVLKDLEELQPTRFRLENRVMAYVFVCVLGYLLYSVFRERLGKSPKMSPLEALEELERIRQVIFRTGETELRQLTELTKKQKEIVKALKMEELFGL